jgi:hypothetical protein
MILVTICHKEKKGEKKNYYDKNFDIYYNNLNEQRHQTETHRNDTPRLTELPRDDYKVPGGFLTLPKSSGLKFENKPHCKLVDAHNSS